ncbi:conserved protein of unknown function (Zinc finger, DksA/TraR C4-type 32-65) [Magnetospirillum sp. XM-1]|nr:conserved protein of unknown function (Zinc finger, DksA/TraR C4-type 32-65) [Magnetospirillum sp. XM-1]
MDDADRATLIAEYRLADAIERARRTSEASGIPSTGICTECGFGIEAGRLEIIPTARLCGACAREADAQARRSRINGED